MYDSYVLPVLLVTVVGLVAGIVLVLAAKFMAVKTDEKFEAVRAVLPGANCGACGYAGCDDYAANLAKGNAPTNLCTPGGAAVAHAISDALGTAFEEVVETCAVVHCSGICEATHTVMDYQGRPTCAAAASFFGGEMACTHACLGFGDCVGVCEYDAIHVVDGVAVVNRALCTGCAKCTKVCPHQIISLVPRTSRVFVACSSTDKGALTRKLCKNGCIGCKKCEKACPEGAITVSDNLAKVDPAKCINCGICIDQCPTGVIRTCLVSPPHDPATDLENNGVSPYENVGEATTEGTPAAEKLQREVQAKKEEGID